MNNHRKSARHFAVKPLVSAVAAAAFAAALSTPVLAQDAPKAPPGKSVLMEELTVTAQKREEISQDVGISMSVFSGSQLESLGLEKSTDIARMTPGVHIGGSIAGQNSQFTIRGVTQNDFADHTESPIAVYIDDAYVAMGQGQNFAMFDLDRVEILKGPQSTLFGRNATGGLVHYLTKKPTTETEGYLKAGAGDYDKVTLEGAYGGAMVGDSAYRLSAYYTQHDALLQNDYQAGAGAANSGVVPGNEFANLESEGGGSDLWTDETLALRSQLLFNIGEESELWLGVNWAESTQSSGQYQSYPTTGIFQNYANPALREQVGAIHTPGDFTGVAIDAATGSPVYPGTHPAGTDYYGYKDSDGLDLDHHSNDFAFDDLNEYQTLGMTGKFDIGFDNYDFISVTDYKQYGKEIAMDVDAAPINQLSVWWDSEVWQFTQELRWQGTTDGLKWVGGAYYMHVDNDNVSGFKGVPGMAASLPPPLDLTGDYPAYIDLVTDSYSLFGQVDLDLNDSFTLITGLRLIQEEKDFEYHMDLLDTNTNLSFAHGPRLANVVPEVSDSSSDTLWAGKIQLDWTVTDNFLAYAGLNRGIKAGSFNGPIDYGITQSKITATKGSFSYKYDEEVLHSLEVGFKSDWWDQRARLNGAVFYYDYSDYQSFLFTGVSGIVVNNDAEVTGGELDFTVSPVDGLDVAIGAAVFDATVEDVEVATNVYRDVKPSFAPEVQYTALVRYAWDMFGGEMAVQWDYSYSDDFYYSLRNYDAHLLEDYEIHNARVGYVTGDGKYEVAAFVDNLTDERYATIGFDISEFCGCSEIATGAPRWWGVEGKINF